MGLPVDPQLPLLIWVDNDISSIIPKVMEATQQGLTVFQFTSTAATKAWVRINEGEWFLASKQPG